MGINIKNPKVQSLIRELAQVTGKGQTEVVGEAVEQMLAREKRKGMAERLLAIGRETAPLFKAPYDTIDHAELLYDEKGLPEVIVDASALVAIIRNEPDAAIYADALEQAGRTRISAANYFEAAIVVDGSRDPVLSRRLDDLMSQAGVTIEPVTEHQARVAREAYRDYGKGMGHPARLNFGDCFAYALARTTGEPLLFKGGDFIHTDVRRAVP